MKEFVTLEQMNSGGYKVLEIIDSRFYSLHETLTLHFYSNYFNQSSLIDWLKDDKKESIGSEWVSIDKEDGVIALYDVSASMSIGYCGNYIDPTKRFVMTRENFKELLEMWNKLQESKSDIILLVIDENDYVSLQVDPIIIKQYQDAGYAFDINKNVMQIQEFLFLQKKINGAIDVMFSNVTSLLYMLPDIFLTLYQSHQNVNFDTDTIIVTNLYFNTFIFYHQKQDKMYIGSLGKMDEEIAQKILHPHSIFKYMDSLNSFSLSYQDFIAIKKSWDELERIQSPYYMMYRNAQGAIFCKGFESVDAMIDFVKKSMPDKGKMVGDFSL